MKKISSISFVVLIACLSEHALAKKSSTTIALELGSVLAAEKSCGLKYNQKEIESFIFKNIDESDMGFPSSLEIMTSGSRYQFDSMGASQRTAHCAQIKRVAKKYKFIN